MKLNTSNVAAARKTNQRGSRVAPGPSWALLLAAFATGLVLGCGDSDLDPGPFAELAAQITLNSHETPQAEAQNATGTTSNALSRGAQAGSAQLGPAIGTLREKNCVMDTNRDGVLTLGEFRRPALATPGRCAQMGGAVTGSVGTNIRPRRPGRRGRSGGGVTLTVPTITQVPQVILDFIAGTGIPGREYVEDEYDCDDFASDLEQAFEAVLPAAGTFTYITCLDDHWEYTEAHAITDVHSGGAIAWFEPQTGLVSNLDQDGDGLVSFDLDFSNYPTPNEGDCFIAVFESAAAAVAAGLELD